jgi:hypothetical protein
MSETVAMGFVRRRRSRAEAEELVREFEASGLNRQVFCAEHGLSVAALDKYRRQYGQGTTGSEGGLVAVEVIPEVAASKLSSALFVELANGRRIEVCSGFDAATLNRLLSVLEQA